MAILQIQAFKEGIHSVTAGIYSVTAGIYSVTARAYSRRGTKTTRPSPLAPPVNLGCVWASQHLLKLQRCSRSKQSESLWHCWKAVVCVGGCVSSEGITLSHYGQASLDSFHGVRAGMELGRTFVVNIFKCSSLTLILLFLHVWLFTQAGSNSMRCHMFNSLELVIAYAGPNSMRCFS